MLQHPRSSERPGATDRRRVSLSAARLEATLATPPPRDPPPRHERFSTRRPRETPGSRATDLVLVGEPELPGEEGAPEEDVPRGVPHRDVHSLADVHAAQRVADVQESLSQRRQGRQSCIKHRMLEGRALGGGLLSCALVK